MIVGIGADIIHISRIEKSYEKYGKKFLERIFSDEEIKASEKYKDKKAICSHFAKRFAAKEAVAKALGTGMGKNIFFKDVSVTNLDSGKPVVNLEGSGRKTLISLMPENVEPQMDLSLSDDYPLAQAVVIISYGG